MEQDAENEKEIIKKIREMVRLKARLEEEEGISQDEKTEIEKKAKTLEDEIEEMMS